MDSLHLLHGEQNEQEEVHPLPIGKNQKTSHQSGCGEQCRTAPPRSLLPEVPFTFFPGEEGVGSPCQLPKGLTPSISETHDSVPQAATLLAAVGKQTQVQAGECCSTQRFPLQLTFVTLRKKPTRD